MGVAPPWASSQLVVNSRCELATRCGLSPQLKRFQRLRRHKHANTFLFCRRRQVLSSVVLKMWCLCEICHRALLWVLHIVLGTRVMLIVGQEETSEEWQSEKSERLQAVHSTTWLSIVPRRLGHNAWSVVTPGESVCQVWMSLSIPLTRDTDSHQGPSSPSSSSPGWGPRTQMGLPPGALMALLAK